MNKPDKFTSAFSELGKPRPVLVVMCGLTGAGKTRYVKATTLRDCPIVDAADFWRRAPDDLDKYDRADWVRRECFKAIRQHADQGAAVIVYEAMNLTNTVRLRITGLANTVELDVIYVWIATTANLARQHLGIDERLGDETAEARLAMLESVIQGVVDKRLIVNKPKDCYVINPDGGYERVGEPRLSVWLPLAPFQEVGFG
jgi:predicted kinase